MRYVLICLLLAMGCDQPENTKAAKIDPVEVPAAKNKVQLPLTGEKPLSKSVAAAAEARGLNAPLPDAVTVDFPYNVVMETERVVAGVKVRNIMMEPKVPVADAVASLTKSFQNAGFKASEATANTVGFSKGGKGEGMMAIASGGRHVALTFNSYKPDNDRVKDGYTGMINFAINTGEK